MESYSVNLISDVKALFEPRYNRTISNNEAIEIANNLANLTKLVLKFRWRLKHEQATEK